MCLFLQTVGSIIRLNIPYVETIEYLFLQAVELFIHLVSTPSISISRLFYQPYDSLYTSNRI